MSGGKATTLDATQSASGQAKDMRVLLSGSDCCQMLEIHLNAHCRDGVVSIDSTIHRANALPKWKRALDLACLVFAAPALLPIMAMIAAAIRLSSRGPVLFRQERIGLRGQPFMCFKFRTMTHSAET